MRDPRFADASPEKRLFISLLTRDITMIAAFLDLIDNSINAAVVPFAHKLRTASDYANILTENIVRPSVNIDLTVSDTEIAVIDSANGISAQAAASKVFKFGRSQDEEREDDRLSVYGIGLKRAFFKLGNRVRIVSDHVEGGFELDLNVATWARKGELPWTFRLEPREAVTEGQCGTRIHVSELYPETTRRMRDGVFCGQLRESVSKIYAYYLSTFVRVFVNGDSVAGLALEVAKNRSSDRFDLNGVTCAITAGIGVPEAGKYRERASGRFYFAMGVM